MLKIYLLMVLMGGLLTAIRLTSIPAARVEARPQETAEAVTT